MTRDVKRAYDGFRFAVTLGLMLIVASVVLRCGCLSSELAGALHPGENG
jgi:hypothetical protein